MRVFKGLIIVCLIYLTSADDKFFPPGPPLPPGAGNQTTTIAPSPNSTTTTTTTPKPSPSPNSTTTTTTTTVKPTTTSTTTTTTQKPTTTSTAATTTTAKPTPTPKPLDPVGKWVSNYTNTNRTCLVLAGALDIDVNYHDGNVTKNLTVHVPSDAKADGVCGNNTSEKITLTWGSANNVNFNFKRSNDTKKYDLQSVIVMLNVSVPGGNDTKLFLLAHTKEEFSTPVSNSYKCLQQQSLSLSNVTVKSNYSGILRISHFQMQAFRNDTNTKFDEALDCATSETPDVVPIAVGCALAALVIIVLIAYLIGRRRSQARGYLSM